PAASRPDRLGTVVEQHDAGMRVAMMVGADRSDDDRQRALLRCYGRALPARSAKLSISGSVLIGLHAVIDEYDLAPDSVVRRGAQCIDAVECDDFAGDSLRPGGATVAER